MTLKKFYVIDGSSYLYRAFYAIRGLSNSKGEPTNAVYGVTNMMLKLFKDVNPEYLCVCFDLPEPTFRHKDFAEYKSHRKPTPDALIEQIPKVKEVISSLGIECLEHAGYEADDLMAAIAKEAQKEGFETYLITGDKDILQLVDSSIFVMRVSSNGTEIYDESKVIEKYGVSPNHFPDFIGLMGDSVDNIPGVPGMGEKTSRALLEEYGDLDNLLAHSNELKSKKQKELLIQYADQARQSRELARLNPEIPLEINMSNFHRKPVDTGRIRELFRELEFSKLLSQLDLPEQKNSIEKRKVQSEKDIDTFIKEWNSADKISFSLENNSGDSGLFAFYIFEYVYIISSQLMAKILNSEKLKLNSKRLYGYELKNIINFLRTQDLNIAADWFDISLAGYLVKPHHGGSNLSALSLEYLGKEIQSPESTDELDFDQSKTIKLLAEKAYATYELGKKLENILKEEKLEDLFYKIEMPLVHVLAEMEFHGIKVDVPLLKSLSSTMTHQMNRLSQDIYKLADEEFNINSPKQLAKILFEKLKLPAGKKTKTKSRYSTNVEVLEELSSIHPLPEKILEYRSLSKLQSTYIDALIQQARSDTHTVHTSFQQTVASTGRIISTEPNLQNLPIHSEWGDKIRECFIPRDSKNLFLSADYSQIELRVLAHLSDDAELKKAFLENKDIHTETATDMFKVDPKDVTPQMRRAAKAINFGIVYGMSAFGLSKSLKISRNEAQSYIDTYFRRYPKVRAYLNEIVDFTKKNGYVLTVFGRRCYIPDIQNPQTNIREAAERQAINAPIQGSAADLLKRAMVNIHTLIKEKSLNTLLLLTIHDELVLESPKSEIETLKEIVKKEMESAMKLSIPVIVEMGVGKNLAEC